MPNIFDSEEDKQREADWLKAHPPNNYAWDKDPVYFGNNRGGVPSDVSFNRDGFHWGMNSPGSLDPSQINPYAGEYLGSLNSLYNEFSNSAAGGAFNPNYYKKLQDVQEAHLTSALGNQYARMGLSGSSAEMGGMANAIDQNQMSWLNRQQSDQMRALSGLESLNQQRYGMTMGIQNQYSNFQDAYNQDIMGFMGLNNQKDAANQAMWGQIGSGVLGAAGYALGGYLSGKSPSKPTEDSNNSGNDSPAPSADQSDAGWA